MSVRIVISKLEKLKVLACKIVITFCFTSLKKAIFEFIIFFENTPPQNMSQLERRARSML